MLIRQNPVCQAVFNSETSHFCARLSREIIRAHDLYISHYPEARAIGYFTTSSTVECIYHLALVMHDSKDQDEHAACVSAFGQAHGILVKLSSYNKVAKRALKALNSIVRRWGGGTSNSTSDAARDNLRQPGAVDRIVSYPSDNVSSKLDLPRPLGVVSADIVQRPQIPICRFRDFRKAVCRTEVTHSATTLVSG